MTVFPCIVIDVLIYIDKVNLVKCFQQMLYIQNELLKIKQMLRKYIRNETSLNKMCIKNFWLRETAVLSEKSKKGG